MNGPTAASPPPPPMSGPRQPSMGGVSGPPYPPSGMNNMQQQQHNQQHPQQQFMPPPQMMNMHHLPPQLQQHLATLPPQMQQQFMQQQMQHQQQMHHQQQQQQQPPQPSQQQQAFTGQQPTAQMLAHMNNVINGQGGPQPMQNNPAFRAAALAAAQAHAQGKPFNPDDKGHPLHPSQMQNFLQAQARAQAQMQASTAASSASQQQQGPPPPPSSSSFQQQIPNHASPRQQTHYIQPPNLPNRQTPTLAPTLPANIPPHVLAASTSSTSSPINQIPQPQPQHLQHPHGLGQLSQPSQAELQLAHADPVAGPSNPRAMLNHQQQQQQHDRRPSMDQIALMQRLSQMAQKGGLPIQSLFTKTSWMTLSSSSPDAEGNEQIPNFTEWDKKNLEIWMEKDLQSVDLVKREKMRIRESLEELAQDIIDSQDWLGPVNDNGDYPPVQAQQFHVRSRKEMERDLSKGKRKRRPWLEFSKKQLRNIAKIDECLIPIRLDLEHEGRKCSDTFTWNLNDTLINPSIFADIMCEDLLLPHDPFHSIIISSIHEQIKQFQEAEEAHPRSLFIGTSSSSSSSASNVNTQGNEQEAYASNGVPSAVQSDSTNNKPKDNDMMGQDEQDEDEEQEEEDWWEGWRKKVRLSQAIDIGQEIKDIPWHEGADAQDDLSKTGNEPPVIVTGPDELRITIQLDIAVDNLNLRDQFEWDLTDPQNSPEEFAAVYCADLGLPGEFQSAVSHLIREQLDAHSRSLSSIRHIRGDQILHDELRNAFHSTLSEAIRSDDVENWTPHLGKLDLVELEHRERERERQSRRHKRGARNNRRNVVTLPDREPLRTSRTMMPKPGAVLEVAENTGPDDPASVPSYAIASPYPLVPVKYDGPPPRMSSPLRRTIRKIDPVTGAVIVEAATAALPLKMKPPGKRRGRPAFDISARETAAEGTPPPVTIAASMNNGSPAPGAVVPPVKRPVGRPPLIKKPAGWTRIEMTTHENIIDGKWHCTNCGVPEPVAVGRRKGPAGPNTQCAECGKYFMSNKGRLRPCEYTTDPAYHQARQIGFAQPASVRHSSRQPTPATAHPDSPGGSVFEPESGDESKPSIHDESFDISRNFAPKKEHELPVILPPARKSSTPAYPAGAGKGKGKGNKGAGKGLPPFPKSSNTASADDQQRLHPHQKSLPPIRLSPNRLNSQLASSSASPPNPGVSPNPRPTSQPRKQRPEPPAWMTEAVAKLQIERPDDRFEIILKPKASPEEALEWRLKCLDCPGKVYKTGPDKTLDNFSAHLRFKGHRMSVNARLALEL